MKVKAANGIARILQQEGVPWISTFPVSEVNEAAGEEGSPPILMMREERHAVALADAFSRVTGGRQIGVCTVQGGINAAGLELAYGALAQAYEDSSPVLCLTDGVPADADLRTHWDMRTEFRGVTKWAGHIERAQDVPAYMRRAYTMLRTGRPGPVLVTIRQGLGEYAEDEYPYHPPKGWRSAPDPDDVKAAVTALLRAENPVLYAGQGVLYGGATDELRQLAELAQVPVITTLKGKSAFPEDHPLSLGIRGDLVEHFLKRADVALIIGSSASPGRFSHAIPNAKDKTIIHGSVDALEINRSYHTAHALIGDAKLTLQGLVEEVSNQTGGGVREKPHLMDEIRSGREKALASFHEAMASNESPINPYRVFGDLMKVLDLTSSFVTADSGNTRDQVSTVYQARTPHGFLGWGNVSTLGFSLAGVMAAKLAYPDRQCVNLTGDAAIGYMLGNFEALTRYGIGTTTVHINNAGFGGYGPGFWGEGKHPYTWQLSEHGTADYAQAAAAMGFHAECVSEPAEIAPALKRALDANDRNRPAYLEFICSQYPVYPGWMSGS